MAVSCTNAEWRILEVLWDQHPRTMSDITATLEPDTGWTRHTVITLLKRMQDKGTVLCDDGGAVKLYSPKVTREQASAEQTRSLLNRVFSGKTSLLIHHLVDSGEMTEEELRQVLQSMKHA